MRPFLGAAVSAALAIACVAGRPAPAALDTGHDACSFCRMVVSDARVAAQLVAPGEEPRFFDDIGCLRSFLAEAKGLPDGAAAFVADHRTGMWVPAAAAVYSRVPRLDTPMASHIVAHADAASLAADPAATEGASLTAAELFGAAGPPGAGR